jgi:hypothetical protein
MSSSETKFDSWVDHHVNAAVASKAEAYCFHLYEHEHSFAVQLVGANKYDEDEPFDYEDEVFTSGEDVFELPHSKVGKDWRKGLKAAIALVHSYLEDGQQAQLLKSSRLVGVGFVDGDLELVYTNKSI